MSMNVNQADSPTSDGQRYPFCKEILDYGLGYSHSAEQGFPTTHRNCSPPPFLLDTISFTSDTLVERVVGQGGSGTAPIPVDPISALSVPDLSEARDANPPREESLKQNQFSIPPLSLSEPLTTSDVRTNSSKSVLLGLEQSSNNEHVSLNTACNGNLASLAGTSQLKTESAELMVESSNEGVPSNFVAFGSVANSMEKLLGNRRTESLKARNTTHVMTNSGSVPSKKKRTKGAGTGQGLSAVSSQSVTTLKEQRARRNRESAKRSRIKNKLYFEKLEATYFEVCNENKSLKQIVEQLLPSFLDASPDLRPQLEALFDANPSVKL